MKKYPFKTSIDILEEKLQEYRRYIQVLYKENQELKEIINNKFKADLLKQHEPISKKDVIHNEIHNSNIGMKFQEDAINEMYDEEDDYHTGF